MKNIAKLTAVLLCVSALLTACVTQPQGGTPTTTVQNGETTTVQNGETTTVQSGETTTVQSGETTTVQSGETTTVQSGETTTVQSGETTTVQSGVTTTVQSGVTTTVQSGVTTTKVPTTVQTGTTATKTPTTVQPTVSTTRPTAPVLSNYDKPWQSTPAAYLYDPVESHFDDQAKAMRDHIDALPDTVKAKAGGTTYYVSPNGNDNNDGKSPQTAWKTVLALRSHTFKAGDAVLFERGGVYRSSVQVQLTSGVSYGAYGTGDRPALYGSNKNYATSQWIDRGGNKWTLNERMGADVGLIVFNHGEEIGERKYTAAEVTKNFDFYHDKVSGTVTMYLDHDPRTYKSVEIGWNGRIFVLDGEHDITIENLTFKYNGGHAIRASGVENITIRGVEIGFIGGSDMSGGSLATGQPVRYGNGIDMIGASRNTLIENCWIYQIYDSGITYQDYVTVYDFKIKNCLLEYCGMGAFEYWGSNGINTLIEGNIMRFAGYGFGGDQRPDKILRAHIQSNGNPGNYGAGQSTNFVIRNNIFDQSAYQLINATSSAGTPPLFDGNTYAQKKGNKRRPLGYYKDDTQLYFDANVAETIKNVVGDKNATVIYY